MHKKPFSIHYAWVCCLAGALLFFTTVGLSGNGYSIYQPYFAEEFNLTQTQLAFMNTCRQLAGITAMALLGLYYRRINLKWGMIFAAVLSTAGFFCMSAAGSYPLLLIACLITGAGNCLGGMVPISMLLDRWFNKKRSLAVSVCSASSGIATFLAPGLITASIETGGLQRTLLGQAALMSVMCFLCAFLFVDSPSKLHTTKYGDTGADSESGITRKDPPSLSGANWAIIYFMLFLMGGLSGCALAILPLVASSQGYSASEMATCMSLGGISLLVGKLLFGVLCEKISQYKATLLYGFIMITGLTLLCFSGYSRYILYAGSIFYIGTLAMIAIGLVSWTSDWVIEKDWAKYRQRFQLIFTVGSLAFSIIPGILADHFHGSYLPTVYILLGESVVCLVILYRTYKSLQRKEQHG